MNADVTPSILADLLIVASEAGPEVLIAADRQLRELVGPDAVNRAHRLWTARLREAVEGSDLGDHHRGGRPAAGVPAARVPPEADSDTARGRAARTLAALTGGGS